MDIQDLGAIGELIGSIAVVVTLIYLAQQIRQNTRQLHVSNSQNSVENHYNLVTPLAMDKEFLKKWKKAGSHFDELDEDEQDQFVMYEWRALSSWRHYHQLRESGLVTDSHWHELTWVFENVGQRGSMRAAWKMYRTSYSLDFREFMDTYLLEESANDT